MFSKYPIGSHVLRSQLLTHHTLDLQVARIKQDVIANLE